MKIPLTLVSGFLGSGKTTLLKSMASRAGARKLAFLVNEFSDVGVDPQRLIKTDRPVFSVVGGSIFCVCKVTEFLGHLKAILKAHNEQPFDELIVETSGMANPAAVHKLFLDTGLGDQFEIREIITVVSALNTHKLAKTLPAFASQVSAASTIYLNKTDLAGAEIIEKAEGILSEINTKANIVRTINCEGAAPPDGEQKVPILNDSLASDPTPYTSYKIAFSEPTAKSDVVEFLDSLNISTLRVKGTLLTSEGWGDFDYMDRVSSFIPTETSDSNSSLVIITTDENEDVLIANEGILKISGAELMPCKSDCD